MITSNVPPMPVPHFRWGHPGLRHNIGYENPIYKYVDEDHAQYLEKGSIKLGTLWSFGDLEDQRSDSSENTSSGLFEALSGDNPRDRAFLKALGFDVPPGVNFRSTCGGTTFHVRSDDLYACCFSADPDRSKLIAAKPQAIFKVDDIYSFVNRVCQLVPQLGPATCGKVRYGDRSISLDRPPFARPSPFVKPVAFERENEVRIVWAVSQEYPVGPLPLIAPLPPDTVVASLLQRVA